MRKWLFALTLYLLAGLLPIYAQQEVAQVKISPTAVPAVLVTATTLPTQLALATVTPTWTLTPEAAIQLEVRTGVDEVNVRQEPDPESQRLGTIKPGQKYAVRARYFRWIQFEFSQSQSGLAWVFEDLVTIIGDASAIPSTDPYSEPSPTPNATEAAFALMLDAVTLTPGADLTLIAQQRVLSLAVAVESGTVTQQAGILPTFTPPAEVIPLNSGQSDASLNLAETGVIEEALAQVTSGNVPPIVPIALLVVGGLFGLLVSSLRR